VTSVGRQLFTKRIAVQDERINGFQDAEDITDLYKNREGTEEERMTVLNAARRVPGLASLFGLPPPGKTLSMILTHIESDNLFLHLPRPNRFQAKKTFFLNFRTLQTFESAIQALLVPCKSSTTVPSCEL
jgi:hypothetical protein